MLCALEVKTCYSILSSLNRIDILTKKAKDMGYSSLAITDLNNMFGVYEFYLACLNLICIRHKVYYFNNLYKNKSKHLTSVLIALLLLLSFLFPIMLNVTLISYLCFQQLHPPQFLN